MEKITFSPTLMLCVALSALMLLLTFFESHLFPLFSLYSDNVRQGEIWRLLTANFVHFGWAHTGMNLAALLLCTFAFFTDASLKAFSFLLLWSCLVVGSAIVCFSPEYTPYAGLSGALHGLIVAGLLQTRTYPLWIRVTGLGIVAAKLVQENSAGYEATDLQQLIPAAVAVESHLYGAIGGFVFTCGSWLVARFAKNKNSKLKKETINARLSR